MSENNSNFKLNLKPNVAFPSQLDTFENKVKKEWGLMLGNAISSEWYTAYFGMPCLFYTQRRDFIERRAYANGMQSMEKYKDSIGTNGDLSLLNLSKKPISRIRKLSDIVINGFCNRGYSVRATSVDQVSQEQFQKYRKQVENDMLAKDIVVKAKQTLGVDVGTLPIDQIPESKDELNLHLQLNYKPSIELSEELAIETVLRENKYDDITNRLIVKDLVELGIAWVKNRFVADKGILVEYVNPENKIHSYTDDPYFRDCYYHGEFKTVMISDVLVEYPNIIDEDKAKLEQSTIAWWNYHSIPQNQRIKGTCNLLYFTYKTTKEKFNKVKEKSNGEKIVSDAKSVFFKDESQPKNQKEDFKRISKVDEILFEGVLVLGTEILLKWGVSENMARPESNKQKVMDSFYGIAPNKEKGFIGSLVQRMIPIDDLIQICELKSQQIIQRIIPDGYQIDIDALAEMDLGDGKVLSPMDHFNMMMQTGSIFVRSYGAGGEYNYAKLPITELKTGDSLGKLQALKTIRDSYIQDQLDVIGLNKASDASTPDKDSLVGLQKLASLNTNTATRHILDASIYLTKSTCESITYRLADILKYYPELKKDLIRKIGATSVEDLESVENLHLYDFAIFLDLHLDDEEKAKLEQDMSVAIEKGYMNLADKYRVMNVKNFKQAVQLMSILVDKYQKKQQEIKQQDIQSNAQAQAQSAQQAEGFRQQTVQIEMQAEQVKQKAIGEAEIAKENTKGEWAMKLEQLKGQNALQVAQVQGGVQMQKLNTLESNKDERLAKQASQTSQIKHQAQTEGEPIDFQSQETDDSMFELPQE